MSTNFISLEVLVKLLIWNKSKLKDKAEQKLLQDNNSQNQSAMANL